MAWFKTGGGGALSETVLWTNPSPTSSLAAGNRTITGNFSDYKYVKIEWRYSTSSQTKNNIIISIDEFKTMTSTGGTCPVVVAIRTSNTIYGRVIYYVDDTTFANGSAYPLGGTTAANANVIITQISGLK